MSFIEPPAYQLKLYFSNGTFNEEGANRKCLMTMNTMSSLVINGMI